MADLGLHAVLGRIGLVVNVGIILLTVLVGYFATAILVEGSDRYWMRLAVMSLVLGLLAIALAGLNIAGRRRAAPNPVALTLSLAVLAVGIALLPAAADSLALARVPEALVVDLYLAVPLVALACLIASALASPSMLRPQNPQRAEE